MMLAVFLLSKGAATLNNIQDINLDKKLNRTKGRPLPAGLVHWSLALLISLILIGTSFSIMISLKASSYLLVMSGVSIVVYNLLYTYTKRVSTISIFPGAVCGMLPPYLGWLIHNNGLMSFPIFVVMMILFVWQFPHFWLITRFNEKDYGHLNPTLPAMLKLFDSDQFNRIILIWVLFYALVTLFLPMTTALELLISKYLIVGNAFFISMIAFWLFFRLEEHAKFYKKLFMNINFSLLNIIIVFIIDRALL
jgi:protoheme IX farnesyltransferase